MQNDNYQGPERRQHPRIYRSFMIRFKPKGQEDSDWQVSTTNNISRGGCYFNSDNKYNAGELLDIDIRFPVLRDFMRFTGEVNRCEFRDSKNFSICGLAVQFLQIEEDRKKVFQDTLDFFLKKQQSDN